MDNGRGLLWVLASLALHMTGLKLAEAQFGGSSSELEYIERHDVWQGAFVEIVPEQAPELGDSAEAATNTAAKALPSSPAKSNAASGERARETSVAAEPARATTHSPTTGVRQNEGRANHRPAQKFSAEDTGATRPARSGSEPERDELVERLMASEKRKAERRKLEQQAVEAAVAANDSASPAAAEAGGAKFDSVPGVRNLATAFTRAIPYATNADPVWSSLPLGSIGKLKLSLKLREGRLETSTIVGNPASALRRLERRTVLLLKGGRFALPYGQSSTGLQELEIDVNLRQGEPQASLTLGFEPPTATRAGEAYFVLASGLRFEARVTVKN